MALIRIKPSNLAAGSVLEAALATGAVTTNKIAGAAVTDDKLSATSLIRYQQRQTVLQGPEWSDGRGSWIVAADAGSLVVKTDVISASLPLIVSASMGYGAGYGYGSERIGSCSAKLDEAGALKWTLPSNSGKNYLYVDVNADGTLTANRTTVKPVYSPSATSGTNTFNYNKMVMYTTGTTKGFRVFVGEATAGATGYSDAFAYCHRGEYYNIYDHKPNVYLGPLNQNTQTISHYIGAPCGLAEEFGKVICFTACTVDSVAMEVGRILPIYYYNNSYISNCVIKGDNLTADIITVNYNHWVHKYNAYTNLQGFQDYFRWVVRIKRAF